MDSNKIPDSKLVTKPIKPDLPANIVSFVERSKFEFNLSDALLKVNGDYWTIGDAVEGVQIFGGTGSGKTSGSGQTLAKTYLYNLFGGLVLTVKAGDALMWEQYCKDLKRSEDLVMINTDGKIKFNFLDYLVKKGYNTINITHVLLSALQKSNSGDYWQNAMEQLIKNTINLLITATGSVSIQDMYKIVINAPKSPIEASVTFDLEQKEGGYFKEIYLNALANMSNIKDEDTILEFEELTSNYWQYEFPNMDPEPRSSIISMFTSLADNLLRGEIRSILSCDPKLSNFNPETIFEGKIVVLDLNIKQFRETGKMAQLIFKTIFQIIVEKERENLPTKEKEGLRPIFLWIDEAQFFLTASDVLFQTTARSTKTASVYLTQNYSNYLAFVGSNREKATVYSFLAVLQTKFCHCQSDPVTNNDYVSKLIGKDYVMRESENLNTSQSTGSRTTSKILDYKILPWKLDQLSKGGLANNQIVEAILYQSGRNWKPGQENFTLVTFNQDI